MQPRTGALSATPGALPSPSYSSPAKRRRDEEPAPAPREEGKSERRARRKEEKRRKKKERGESEKNEPPPVEVTSDVDEDSERARKRRRRAERKASKPLESSQYTSESSKATRGARLVEKAAATPRKLTSYDKDADMESIVEATAGMDEDEIARFFSQATSPLQLFKQLTSSSSSTSAASPAVEVTTSRKGEALFDGLTFADFLASSGLKLSQIYEIAEEHGFDVALGPFTPTEDQIIDDVLKKYAKSQKMEWDDLVEFFRAPSTDEVRKAFWYKLTKALKCRPLLTVRKHVRFKYSPFARKGKFTPDEITKLMDAVKTHGTAWTIVGEIVGRPPATCDINWRRNVGRDSVQKSGGAGRWKSEETELLKKAVAKFGNGQWASVVRMVPARTAEECSDRWRHLSGKKAKFPTSLRGPLVKAISMQGKKSLERIKWSKIRVDALSDYSERRLVNAWLRISKAAVAAGVSQDDFRARVAWGVESALGRVGRRGRGNVPGGEVSEQRWQSDLSAFAKPQSSTMP